MLKRREFLRRLATLFLMLFSGCLGESDISGAIEKKNISIKKKIPLKKYAKSEVYVIKSDDRENGIKELLKYFDMKSLSGKRIALKANYNSQDPFPASTHIDTIGTLVDALKEKGFLFPKVFEDADAIIQTCCLKTHGYSDFTMSLKNSVGMVAAGGQDGYSYMDELHSSSYKGQMIAEINTAYEPEFEIIPVNTDAQDICSKIKNEL